MRLDDSRPRPGWKIPRGVRYQYPKITGTFRERSGTLISEPSKEKLYIFEGWSLWKRKRFGDSLEVGTR